MRAVRLNAEEVAAEGVEADLLDAVVERIPRSPVVTLANGGEELVGGDPALAAGPADDPCPRPNILRDHAT